MSHPEPTASNRRSNQVVAHTVVSYDFPPKIGGAHAWLYEVYRRWPSHVRVVTSHYSKNREEAECQRRFDAAIQGSLSVSRTAPVREIDLLSPRYWAAAGAQVYQIRPSGHGPHCLHALRAFPEGLAALLYRKTHRGTSKLITYAHGEEILIAQCSRQLSAIARAVYAGSDLVIANSESTKRLLAEFHPAARVTTIHPGVDTAAYSLDPAEVAEYRRGWQGAWPSGTIIVSTIARMEARKNHEMMLRAVARLREQGLPLAYVCGGDGEEMGRIRSLADSLRLNQWATFPGALSDREKRLLLAASDIHAMPSIQVGQMIEGFGIVFLEAAAAGVPSIAGNIGGQAEAVVDGKTGIIVDGTDLAEVSSAVESLARDPQLRADMGQAGKLWATDNDWTRVRDRTLFAVELLVESEMAPEDRV